MPEHRGGAGQPPLRLLVATNLVTLLCRTVARYGSEIDVLTPDGAIMRVNLRRKVDDVVCGDMVSVDIGERTVLARGERRNQLARRDGFERRRTIAANIDRVWVVVAPRPEIPHLLIDRFLVGILNLPAQAGLIINKCDLIDADNGPALEAKLATYGHLRIPVLRISAHSGSGTKELSETAAGGSNILVGQSGVGKSSLIQAMLPGEDLRVGEIGQTGEGRHTTTTARWYPADHQGAWIDSPGVRDFTPEITTFDELVRGFPDLGEISDGCRFRNCTHRSEPGCAVRQAVLREMLPEGRLDAWLELLKNVNTH